MRFRSWLVLVSVLIAPNRLLPQSHEPGAAGLTPQQTKPAGSFTHGPDLPYPFPGLRPREVTGDFNGDGIPDLAISDGMTGSIRIVFGDGSGRLSAASGDPFPIGNGSFLMAASDFNNDGKSDLAVVFVPPSLKSVVLVLLSNGSGGFTTSFSKNIQFLQPSAILATDLNGDGNADLAVGDLSNLTVLIGDGAGGLSLGTGGGVAPVLLAQPSEIAAGDFNGDGNADLAIANRNTNSVTVVLGDGFGGCTSAGGSPIQSAELGPNAVAVGDFNGDGKLDIAVTGPASEAFAVFLGDGIGGFTRAPGSPVLATDTVLDMVSTDFDGDGIPDLALVDEYKGVIICLGAGDGTFHFTDSFPLANSVGVFQGVVADFNRDARPDLALVQLTGSSGYQVSTLLGSLAKTSTTLTATAPSADSPNTFRLVASVNPAPAFTVATGNVRFFDGSNLLDNVPAHNGVATTLVPLALGSHKLSAIYDGDQRTLSSASSTVSLTINSSPKIAQAVSIAPIPDRAFDTAPFRLFASTNSTSGIPVVFSMVSGPAVVNGSFLTVTGAGSITVQASQDGNATYLAAAPSSTTFQVSPAQQTITWQTINTTAFMTKPFQLGATASSGLPVNYAVLSGPITVNGNLALTTGTGAAVIQASQAGDVNYLAAPPALRDITVFPSTQFITFEAVPNHNVSDLPFALSATASSGLTVTFRVTGPANISGNVLTITGTGFVTVEADQTGNANYVPALPVIQSFQVLPAGVRIDRVVNAASYASAAIGSYAIIFGNQFTTETIRATGSATTLLGGVSVMFTDSGGQQVSADLLYASPTQINLIIPPRLSSGRTTAAVTNSIGASASYTFTLPVVTPGIFTATASGTGPPAAYATIVAPDGSTTILPAFQCAPNPSGCTPAPIPLGPPGTKVYLNLYGTGIRGLSGLAGVGATLGGVPATVLYAGPQGDDPALDQINLLVEPFTGPRLVNLQVTVDDYSSNFVQVQFR
jgi:uncharacterized protein (TIGR03437 family)